MSRMLRAAVKAATGHCIFCSGNLWPGQRRGFITRSDGSQEHFHTQCFSDAKRTLHPVWVRWLRAQEEEEVWVRWQQELRAKEEEEL